VRVVIDTNVFVSAALYPRSIPGRIVSAWRQDEFTLVTSPPLLEELRRVLLYPKIVRRTGWDSLTTSSFLIRLRSRSEFIEIQEPYVVVERDTDDSPVLTTLTTANADVLITGDDDLLALASMYPINSPAAFWQRFGLRGS
jgi:putative PIN family toxin of toxin-antitoxin system